MNLEKINAELSTKSPTEIVEWALKVNVNAVVTTNFRPYEQCILHACVSVKKDIKVIWVDSGYNTPALYRHAKNSIANLQLNIDIYTPQLSKAYRDVVLGIPEIDTPEHDEFTRQVKLEPFQEAMKKHQPKVWFTNLRKGQTALRDSLDIVTQDKSGRLKVSPFYHYSDTEMEIYLTQNNLEKEENYYDPTKALANRECGLHL